MDSEGNPEILTMLSFPTVTGEFSTINPESSLHDFAQQKRIQAMVGWFMLLARYPPGN